MHSESSASHCNLFTAYYSLSDFRTSKNQTQPSECQGESLGSAAEERGDLSTEGRQEVEMSVGKKNEG